MNRISSVFLVALFGVFAMGSSVLAAYVSPQNVKVDYTTLASESVRLTWQSGGGTGSNFLLRKSRDGVTYESTAFVPPNVLSYTFSGLSANTAYWFHVSSGDDIGSESPVVTVGPVYSGAYTPKAPTISGLTTNSLQLSITPGDGNTALTTYFIREAEGGLYVQANGTLGNNYYVDTAAGWGTKMISGLQPNTKYAFMAVAKNSDGNNSNISPRAYVTTAGALSDPNPPRILDYGTKFITLGLVPDQNQGSVKYAIQEVTHGGYLQPNGALQTAPHYDWYTNWGSKMVKDLQPNTSYGFKVIMQDVATGQTKNSAAVYTYTMADVPSNLKLAALSDKQATLSWTGNASEYLVQNLTTTVLSGWLKGTSYKMNVSCGQSYQVRVKGENGSGLETAYSSTFTFKSLACPTAPALPPVVITPTVPTSTPPVIVTPSGTTTTPSVPTSSTPTSVIPQPSAPSSNSGWWMWLLLPIGLIVGLIASLAFRRRS